MKTDLLPETPAAVQSVRNGQGVLLPAACGWMVCCDASNGELVQLLTQNLEWMHCGMALRHEGDLHKYLRMIPEVLGQLLAFNTKPLLLELPEAINVPDYIPAKAGNVVFYFSQHPLTQQVLHGSARPLFFVVLGADSAVPPEIPPVLKSRVYVVNLRKPAGSVPGNLATIRFGPGNQIRMISTQPPQSDF